MKLKINSKIIKSKKNSQCVFATKFVKPCFDKVWFAYFLIRGFLVVDNQSKTIEKGKIYDLSASSESCIYS